jgi:hypothetical protein
MDGIYPELARKTDPAKLLGYLNFSDGRPDPRFQKGLSDAAAVLVGAGDPAPWRTLPAWLTHALGELEASGQGAFRDTAQARAALAALARLPAAYRAHHADQLAHQPDEDLFNAFFLARGCEAVLRQGGPWDQADRLVAGAVAALNDYVGYRPIAVLETRPNTDYYPHEKVRPVPLYIQGAGVTPSKYADLVRPALDLLAKTEPVLLEEASFDPEKLDELAFDPRAHDHFHPVNKRPNVLFGEWDPHTIDGRGYFRRFVLRQMTLDTLLTWVNPAEGELHALTDRGERLSEASAVLAGTILMGAGVSGSGPNYHDSTVTLSKLVPRIARYRDAFYQRLLKSLPGSHGDRLREEAERRQQPFAGVRQYLNQAIATQRASHLQERRLAQLFAAMGYPAAARGRARTISAPAVRFGTEIRVRQTEAEFAAEHGRHADAPRVLAEVEDLLRRGIDCGALIDPWSVLGFQGLFPIFPGREDTVRDPRAEELIHTVGRQFELYAKAAAAAAIAGDDPARERLLGRMVELAGWWDRFATSTVEDMPRVIGGERAAAAEHVAGALAAWANRDPAANDLAFWRQHRAGFTSPAAFAQVIEALTAHARPGTPPAGTHKAALGLLMTWLSEGDTVPLEDPSASFQELAERWLRAVVSSAGTPAAERAALARRFFELLDANADPVWLAPDDWLSNPRPEPRGGDDEDDGNEFASAYEGVTYKDSTDDGVDGSVAGGEPRPAGEFALDAEADALEDRLRFLMTLSQLWRVAARPELWARGDPATADTLADWLGTARRVHAGLVRFLERVREIDVPDPVGGSEGMIEFDRRRATKGHVLELGVEACVEAARAAFALTAVLVQGGELPPPRNGAGGGEAADPAPWESMFVRVERAIGQGSAGRVRKALPPFLTLFRNEPLLYCPPSDGGRPRDVLRAQTALSVLEDLLTRLPRLGLIRETFHLTKLARQMEWNSPPEGRRVSSFDQLFRTALVGVVETIVAAAAEWGDEAGADGPLSGMLRHVAESFQDVWSQHSKSLRLSVLESVADDDDWEPVRAFVKEYGGDLFTVPFLGLSNMRGILARGVANWLDHEVEVGDAPDRRPKLIDAWEDGALDRAATARAAEVVLQALIEHYDEYRDYNTTTTQSDYGENIHILLDFLRLKVNYDRLAWRMRPLALAHEVLCRRGQDELAARWREFVTAKTKPMADELLGELAAREAKYGVRLRTVRDRLEERFALPLDVDRAAAQVAPAAEAARAGATEDHPAFARLVAAMGPLSETVSGVGLEVPAWVRRMEDALRKSREPADDATGPVTPALDFDELRRQLQDWDKPLVD